MSEQALDLKRTLRILRRYWLIVAALSILGLVAGGAYAALRPPKLNSSALVQIVGSVSPGASNPAQTLVVVAGSQRVLTMAQPHIRPAISLQKLSEETSVKSLASGVLQITGQGRTADDAEEMANAVANAFVAYMKTPASQSGGLRSLVLTEASTASGQSLPVSISIYGIIGLLLCGVFGSISVLAFSRRDKRLRLRDEIADSIGLPVLASVPVGHPSDSAGWLRLLSEYEPTAVDAWRLRSTLRYLGVGYGGAPEIGRQAEGVALAVISLESDPGAMSLGPQLAVFAASLGIRTKLVVGPQQDPKVTAALRAACSSTMAVNSRFLLVSTGEENGGEPAHAALTVVVAVVNEQMPQAAENMPTSRAVLAVSAGAATAEQLALIAVNATDSGHHLVGILVADPDKTDNTTGRVPQPTRAAAQRSPTHLTGIPTETRHWMTQTRQSQ
jgi:capsular polysaccharide biosynthesis protein